MRNRFYRQQIQLNACFVARAGAQIAQQDRLSSTRRSIIPPVGSASRSLLIVGPPYGLT